MQKLLDMSQVRKSMLLKHLLLLLASCLFLLLYSQAASPLYAVQGVDANVFKIMGLGICQGKIPYAQLFDHKGPVLFYIYALACSLGNAKWGLFAIELIFMYITMLCQYQIARMFLGRWQSVVTLAVTLVFVAVTIDDGGQTEFFEITFAYVAIYYLLRFYKSHDFRKMPRLSAIMGVTFALAALMRLNDGCLTIGVPYFFLVCWLLKERRIAMALKSIIVFVCAAVLVCLPFAVYFLCVGEFAQMWYGMITFNFHYASLSYIQNPMLKVLILSLVGFCAIATLRRRADNTVPLFVILPVVLFSLVGIGNNAYGHYFMILAPTFGLITIWLYGKRYLAVMLWVLVVSGWNMGGDKPMCGSLIFNTYQNIREMRDNPYKREIGREAFDLLQHVPENQRKGDIWAFNLNNSLDMFTGSNLTPANTYFVNAHKDYDSSIRQKEDVKVASPEWVLVQCKGVPPVDSLFFLQHYDSVGAVKNDYYHVKLLRHKH